AGDVIVDDLSNLAFATDPATGLFVPVADFPSKLIDHTVPNIAPTANAGPDFSIRIVNTAQLDGTGSSDSDSGPQPLSYGWTFVSRPPGSALTNSAITAANTARPSFVPDAPGVYELALTVSDGAVSNSDNVKVTVNSTLSATGAAYY